MQLTQKHRLIAIDTALGADVLGLRKVSIREQISCLFQIEAELSSENSQIDFNKVLGNNATVRLQTANKTTRYFNGFVSRFVQVANQGEYAHYSATLVPWLWFLTRTADSRIFQQKKTPDIIEEVFKAHGFNDYKLSLTGSYQPREYCVQYRESDFNFVSRLMEQEGIYYFFEHEDGKHTLVLADSISAHSPCSGYDEIAFRQLQKDVADREAITEWVMEMEVQPGAYSINAFDFEKPKTSLLASANVTRQHGSGAYEIYDYPGDYIKPADGDRLAQVRLDELQSQHEVLRGNATARGLVPGRTFKLKGHPRQTQAREYLVTSIHLSADAGEFSSRVPQSSDEFFTCIFSAIDKAQQFRPARLARKTVVQGPQTAFVVGPSGEEIHTDKYGRVKVQFHWDRYGKADENSSCWVRVSTPSAGKQWGGVSLPRIGQEVIVEFLEGDPDRPIITGRVHNADAMPPYSLPGEKTKSTFKTNSSKGGDGFNELRFEDKKGDEQILLHGEKDLEVRIKNDSKEWIGNERHLVVKKDQIEQVEGAKHSTVKGDRNSKTEGDCNDTVKGGRYVKVEGADHASIAGDQNAKVTGDISLESGAKINYKAGSKFSVESGVDFHEKAGQNYAMEAGQNVHIKAGMNLVIEAGMQLSLKVGGNFIDISPAGVAIKGTMVMINSGGAAGAGAGSTPVAPTAPEAPDAPKLPKPAADVQPGGAAPSPAPVPPKPVVSSDAATVLKSAAADGTPFCEECARAAEQDAEEGDELVSIESIAWLDGDNDKETAGAIQWVNLPQEDKWVDAANGVANKDRLGRKPRFKVKFSTPGRHSFKVKALADADNVEYTDTEKNRNDNFKWQDQTKTYTTDDDGTKIVAGDFFVTCAGADKFKLVAEDTENNPPVETGWLETRRLVYLVPIRMAGMPDMADVSVFKKEFADLGIALAQLPEVLIDAMPNIGSDDEDAFKRRCKRAFGRSKGVPKSPYALGMAFTEYLAVKNPNQPLELAGVAVGPAAPAVKVPVMARGLRAGDGLKARKLWKDLVPNEDWFVSAQFVPDGGGAAVNIEKARCAALPEGQSSCARVSVDVKGLPAGTGTIKVRVNVVDRMRGGVSFKGENLICVGTRGWWKDKAAASQNETLIHEMGHKVNMVCTGTGKQPDKVDTHYSGKGHAGQHCHFGLPVQASYSNANGAQCIMFGSNCESRLAEFCENCCPAVFKMDLSSGWPA
jgi:type VI secretion system secreted protein VgrG